MLPSRTACLFPSLGHARGAKAMRNASTLEMRISALRASPPASEEKCR